MDAEMTITINLEDCLGQLSNSGRLRILRLLRNGALSVGEIQSRMPDLPPNTVNWHIRELKKSRLIDYEAHGLSHVYYLNQPLINEIIRQIRCLEA